MKLIRWLFYAKGYSHSFAIYLLIFFDKPHKYKCRQNIPFCIYTDRTSPILTFKQLVLFTYVVDMLL